MTALTFDTLKYANHLKAAGVPPEQAEAQASALSDVLEVNFKELVTKGDLKTEMTLLRQEIIQSEQRMAIKMGTIVTVAVGAIAALLKLFLG
ncbi:MAG: CCDC90 family protein [Pseudomonadales bacterium]|jgi:hypothetical protein|nr:CCDC90 family protein [Pseudomonadales bacterium]